MDDDIEKERDEARAIADRLAGALNMVLAMLPSHERGDLMHAVIGPVPKRGDACVTVGHVVEGALDKHRAQEWGAF